MNVRNVVIVTKPKQAEVAWVARDLIQWFQTRNVVATLEPQGTSSADLAVVLGGDGTLLAAARLLGDRQVPIVAVNYGGLGFLTEVTLDEMYPALERVLTGEFIAELRMMVELSVLRGGKELAEYRALNDVVINKGTVSRMIELEAC